MESKPRIGLAALEPVETSDSHFDSSENSVVVDEAVAGDVTRELEAQGGISCHHEYLHEGV